MKRGGFGALLGIALAVSSEAGTLDDLARELPRIKPLEPAAALSSFRIHPEKVKTCQEPKVKTYQEPKNDFLASMCPKWVPDTNGTRLSLTHWALRCYEGKHRHID